jgi:hypothetical protein
MLDQLTMLDQLIALWPLVVSIVLLAFGYGQLQFKVKDLRAWRNHVDASRDETVRSLHSIQLDVREIKTKLQGLVK